MSKGLFIGLTTIDLVYEVDNPPAVDEKVVALRQAYAAGGPATNAAVAFSFCGANATLLSSVGKNPLNDMVKHDLASFNIDLIDTTPDDDRAVSFSTVMVKRGGGERSVVSTNAVSRQAHCYDIESLVADNDVVLVDGHQMLLSIKAAEFAKANNIPVVLDGGSWKEGMERLLPFVDYAICSERFFPPGCSITQDVFKYLKLFSISFSAITRGGKSILYSGKQKGEVLVEAINAVDTLGAGDFLHGAFCYYLMERKFDAVIALKKASKLASSSCASFGTREWMMKREGGSLCPP